jgi:cytoskeletal protein CcmA (bactofilin family)
MANYNLIQIKRSESTDAPSSLANGELAYSFTSSANSLYIGDPRAGTPGSPLRMGGGKYKFLHQSALQTGKDEGGVLTANAVVITNANNYLDQFKTNTIVIGPDGTTNSIATFVLDGTANVSGNVTFRSNLTVNGSVTVVGDTTYAGNVAFDTDTLFVDALNDRVGFNTSTPDATVHINGTANVAGNTTIQGKLVQVANASFSNTLAVTGATTLANTLGVTGAVQFSNTLSVTNTATFSNTVGITGAATLSNTFAVTGNATFSNTVAVVGEASFTSNVAFDTDTLYVDVANDRIGLSTSTPDATLHVNGTANVAGNTTIVGALLQVANASFSNSVIVTGNTTLSNTLAVTGATTLSNTVTIAGNTNIDSGTFYVDVTNNRVGINDSTPDYDLDVNGSARIVNDITANNATIQNDLTVQGDLTVAGTLTTIDTQNLIVEDPLFKVAKNNNFANSAGDAVDIGFYGVYANTTADFYAGFFRDATDGTWKLFDDLEVEPSTVVDTANATFSYATLNAFFNIGGLHANNTVVHLTANSTVNVHIVANTLNLATQLSVPNGGTGQTSFIDNGVIYGNGTDGLSVTAAGANGDILKVVNDVPQFGTLDGGVF